MLKTKIIDKLRNLVDGSPEKYDEGDLRLQRIHVLLDDVERNFSASGGKNPIKGKSGKERGFKRGKYAENLRRLEKEVLNIKGLLATGKTQPSDTQKISCEVDSLAKELSVVKKTFVDYSETIESILKDIAAEKMPGKDEIARHDRDISVMKADLLKSVRIADAVASEREELDKRIKKIEDAQNSGNCYDARVKKAVDDAMRDSPLQKDRASIKNSISELKNGLLMLRAEIDTDLAEYPQNLVKFKRELSRIKGTVNSKDSQSKEAEKISNDIKSIANELSMVKNTLVEHSETIGSVLKDIAANNKAARQTGTILKSISSDIFAGREKDRAALEAELSEIRGEICGIKGMVETIKAAETAKRRKQKSRRRKSKSRKARGQGSKKPSKESKGFRSNSSMLRALVEYNRGQKTNVVKNIASGRNVLKKRDDDLVAIITQGEQAKNDDYVELEIGYGKHRRRRIGRRKRKKQKPKNK